MNEKTRFIQFWKTTAIDDLEAIDLLFKGKKYVQALFFAHLCLEKILKAHWVKDNLENVPPKTHNLIHILGKTQLDMTEEDTDLLQSMNTFQIEGRYPDYLSYLQKSVKKEETKKIIEQTEILFACLLKKLP